jgi:putative CocE/NonD family hydrolase
MLMEPNGVYRVEVDLQATSNVFLPGHRIRVEVSSSNFPRFDRNLNTGGVNWDETKWVTASNTIHHTAKYPSHLLLPLVTR